MSAFFEHLKTWWAAHLTWIATLIGFLDPSVQHWIAAHPAEAQLVGGAWALVLLSLRSPLQKAGVRTLLILAIPLLLLGGCNLGSSARDTVATSYGYLTWAQSTYKASCQAAPTTSTCALITRAIGGHNAAVDALDAYCSGAPKAGQQTWAAGGPCAPQGNLASALQSAIAALKPIIADLKQLASGKSQPKLAEILTKPDTRASLLSVRLEGGL